MDLRVKQKGQRVVAGSPWQSCPTVVLLGRPKRAIQALQQRCHIFLGFVFPLRQSPRWLTLRFPSDTAARDAALFYSRDEQRGTCHHVFLFHLVSNPFHFSPSLLPHRQRGERKFLCISESGAARRTRGCGVGVILSLHAAYCLAGRGFRVPKPEKLCTQRRMRAE